MKDNTQKEKFIALRAKNISFDNISKEIGVAKNTLLKWSYELREQVDEMTFTAIESMFEQHHLQHQNKLEYLLSMLQKVNEEMLTRDLSKINTDKLFLIQEMLNKRLYDEMNNTRVKVCENKGIQFEFFDEKERYLTLTGEII